MGSCRMHPVKMRDASPPHSQSHFVFQREQEYRAAVISEKFTQTFSDAVGPMVLEGYFQTLYHCEVFLVFGGYCTWQTHC